MASLATSGIHHVTAIAGDPGRNVAFYTEVLGLRLIKRTINFDMPHTWHLYYADEAGNPGTVLTFFPWPFAARGKVGAGETSVIGLSVPPGALDYWEERLGQAGIPAGDRREIFGNPTLRLADPDGMGIGLVETDEAPASFAWSDGGVPEEYTIRGVFGVLLNVGDPQRSGAFLAEGLGYQLVGDEGGRLRYAAPGEAIGRYVDIVRASEAGPGFQGAGSVHHIAFRTSNDEEQGAWRRHLAEIGRPATPVQDRQYFHSIYFREPGGVLYEIATDGPGFTIDEPLETLGSELRLPPWYEPRRSEIEAALPPLGTPEG
jgi:glyoxalase family protein